MVDTKPMFLLFMRSAKPVLCLLVWISQWMFLWLIMGVELGMAQSAGVQEGELRFVKDYYQYIRQKITREEYYLYEQVLNTFKNRVPETGQWVQSHERYFFSYTDAGTTLLRAVMIRQEREGLLRYEEFVFDNDEALIFYSEGNTPVEASPKRLLKIYFVGLRLLDWENAQGQDQTAGVMIADKSAQVMERAMQLKEKFALQQHYFKDF